MYLNQLCLSFLSFKYQKGEKKTRKPVKCLRMLPKSTPLQPESSRAARSFVGDPRVASVASVGTLPIGIIQQQARFRCGHGCFSRRAFLFPFFPSFDSDRSVAAHAQHVFPFLTTLRCRKTRSAAAADDRRLNLQEWFTGNVSRPAAAARKQLRTSLTTATLNMLTI